MIAQRLRRRLNAGRVTCCLQSLREHVGPLSGRLRSPRRCDGSSFNHRAAVRSLPPSLSARSAADAAGPHAEGMDFVPDGIFIPGAGVVADSYRTTATSGMVPGNDRVMARTAWASSPTRAAGASDHCRSAPGSRWARRLRVDRFLAADPVRCRSWMRDNRAASGDAPVTSLEDNFVNLVMAFLSRSPLNDAQFGRKAVGQPRPASAGKLRIVARRSRLASRVCSSCRLLRAECQERAWTAPWYGAHSPIDTCR